MKEYNFNFENTYSSLGEIFFTHLEPVPVAWPKLLIFNEDLATSIGLDLSSIEDAEKQTANRLEQGFKVLAVMTRAP